MLGTHNLPTYSTPDMGPATNAQRMSVIVTATKDGHLPLSISGYAFTLPFFVLSNSPVTTLGTSSPTSSTNLTLGFTATNSGRYTCSLILTNSDPAKGLFVLNLTAGSGDIGLPPSVTIT